MHTLKEDERRTFNHWWNEGEVSPGNNPYRHESAAYWAWEGWQAGTKAEREACALVAENESNFDSTECGIDVANDVAAAIRARGEE